MSAVLGLFAATTLAPMHEPVRVEVNEKATLEIEWDDGLRTVTTARELRAACQCANCRDTPDAVAAHVAAMDVVTIEAASLVGNYAINFVFGPDHHGTGIYPYEALRSLN